MALPRGERQLNVIRYLADDLGKSTGIETQGVSEADPKPQFERLEHSVYLGRRRLGRYSQSGKKRYAAYDAQDRFLGHLAYAAVGAAADQS